MSVQLQKRYPLPQAHRTILHESCYFDHLHKSLRFMLASNDDLAAIGEYLRFVLESFKRFDRFRRFNRFDRFNHFDRFSRLVIKDFGNFNYLNYLKNCFH